MMGRYLLATMVLIALVAVDAFARLSLGGLPAGGRYWAYALTFVALGIAVRRGGVESYLFWITLIAAYPLMAPLVSQDLFGLRQFAPFVPAWQAPEDVVHPLLLGALACLFLSITLTDKPIFAPSRTGGSMEARSDLLFWAFVASAGMVAMAVIGDPTFSFIGTKAYSEILEDRAKEVRFAGGAWAVFGAMAVFLYIQSLNAKLTDSMRKVFVGILIAGFVVSFLWMIAHARRVEPAGFLIFLLCLFGNRYSLKSKVLLLAGFVALFAIIGYVRNLYELEFFLGQDFMPMPGGVENMFIGYVSMFKLLDAGYISFQLGETYIGHILRLPPGFLGLDRPPEAYDHLAALVRLQGGEYLLVEPYLNFGIIGVVIYLPLLATLSNWSVAAIRRFFVDRGGMFTFMLGSIFMLMIFRTLWYGPGSLVKSVVITVIVVIAMFVVFGGYTHRNYSGSNRRAEYRA